MMNSEINLLKKIAFFLILSFCLNFCSNTNEGQIIHQEAKTIDIDMDAKKDVSMSEVFDDIKYLQLENRENQLIGNIQKILFRDDIIFIFETTTPSVFLYDLSGNYLNQVVINKGQGPEEMTSVKDFTVDAEEEIITTLGFQEIHTYTYEGKLIDRQSLNINPERLTILPDDQYAFFMDNRTYSSGQIKNMGYNLLYSNGSGYNKYLKIEKYKVNLSFGVSNNFPRYNGQQLFYFHPYYNIYELTPDNVSVRYTLDFGEHNAPASLFRNRENFNDSNKFLMKTIEGEYASYLNRFLETESLIYFAIYLDRPRAYPVFYFKDKEVSLVAEKLINDIDGGLTPYFITTYRNELVGYIQPSDLLEKVSKLKRSESELDQNKKKLIQLTEGMDPLDNPILLFAKVKSEFSE